MRDGGDRAPRREIGPPISESATAVLCVHQAQVRFTINVWVGVAELVTDEADVDEQLGQRIGSVMRRGDHWWTLQDDTDVAALATDLRALLTMPCPGWRPGGASTSWSLSLALVRTISRGT